MPCSPCGTRPLRRRAGRMATKRTTTGQDFPGPVRRQLNLACRLITGDIPGSRLGGATRALFVLRRVLELVLGEVQRAILGEPILATAAAGRKGGNDDFLHRDFYLIIPPAPLLSPPR